jgi:hypothetical protein
MTRWLLALPFLLAACTYEPTPLAWMPPPEFDHPFSGTVVRSACPECGPTGRYYARSVVMGNTCLLMLPDESHSTPAGRTIAERVEIANCNGWAARDGDVNDHESARLRHWPRLNP